MSDDLDFDMEVVDEDELDELGAGGASSSEESSPHGTNEAEKRAPTERTGPESSSRSEDEFSSESKHRVVSGARASKSESKSESEDDFEEEPSLKDSPETWQVRKLGDLLSYEVSGTWGDDPEDGKGKPVLRATNFAPNSIDLEDVALRQIPSSHQESKQLEKGDIVLERSGGSADQPTGRVLFFDLDGEYYPGNFLRLMRPKSEVVNRRYLYYCLDYRYRRGDTVPIQTNSTNIRNLQYTSYLNLDVQVPPLPEQRKIASVLYAVDQAIQKTEAIVEQAQRVKRGLMQDLLQRNRSSSGEIEGSWQQLGEVTEWKSGSTPSKGNDAYWGGTTPWVSAKDMKEVKLNGAEDHLTPEGVDEFGTLAPRGSLLVLVRGMRLKDSLPVCLVREEVAFNQDVKALTPTNGLDGEFLAYWLKANENRILGMVTSASHGTKRLGTESLKNFRVWIPPEEFQRETVRIFRAFDQKIQRARTQRNRLSRLKKGLMQDLLTGEVRTADKAIDVLDEIKAHG